MDFHKIYKPITAAPFTHDKSYTEIEPCEALKPYVRCFWEVKNLIRKVQRKNWQISWW